MKESRNTASPVLSGKRLRVINFRLCEPFVLFVIAFLLSSFHLYCYMYILPPSPSYSFLSSLPLLFLPLLSSLPPFIPSSPPSPLLFLPPGFLPLLPPPSLPSSWLPSSPPSPFSSFFLASFLSSYSPLPSPSFIPTSILRCYPVLLAGASMAQGYSDGHNRRFNHN